ncbi:MAG TPA: hypothetical protein ENI16_01200 [Candidatus Portnoybacteria bacterium]|nr:hypothetical protein [Candidatus Portnoybacteria bacterium]
MFQNISFQRIANFLFGFYLLQLLDPTEPGFSRASGTATNRSNYDFEKVQINVVLYDRSGQVIGVNKTQIRNLLSSEKRYFETTWYEQVIGEPRDIDIEPEIDVFESGAFMRQHGVLEKYQEYQ